MPGSYVHRKNMKLLPSENCLTRQDIISCKIMRCSPFLYLLTNPLQIHAFAEPNQALLRLMGIENPYYCMHHTHSGEYMATALSGNL